MVPTEFIMRILISYCCLAAMSLSAIAQTVTKGEVKDRLCIHIADELATLAAQGDTALHDFFAKAQNDNNISSTSRMEPATCQSLKTLISSVSAIIPVIEKTAKNCLEVYQGPPIVEWKITQIKFLASSRRVYTHKCQ